jgi:anti-sigma regulatory factor (Ser/Thr protein kinase)
VATIEVELPVDPESSRRARECLEPLRSALDESIFVDLRLIVSELIAEAVGHAGTHNMALSCVLRDDHVWVSVAEGADAFRLSPHPAEPGARGWSIYLVQRLTRRWAIRREKAHTSRIWFEMPLAEEVDGS